MQQRPVTPQHSCAREFLCFNRSFRKKASVLKDNSGKNIVCGFSIAAAQQ
jgi:hypothetical protein